MSIFQLSVERIDQTLSSTIHTLSMLNDYNIGKRPELDHLWESFKNLSKILNIRMDFTESLYKKVEKKIYNKNYL